jgi:hypothetical protein
MSYPCPSIRQLDGKQIPFFVRPAYPGSDFNDCVFRARSPGDAGGPGNYPPHGMIGEA